jgi:tetratricopeptide (TPR) repeat protein
LTTPEDSSKHGLMPSFSSPSTSRLDRKALKSPDEFISIVRSFFSDIPKHSKVWLGALVVIFLTGLIGAFYMNHSEKREMHARDALFNAQITLDKRLKELAPTQTRGTDAVAQLKIDVDAKLPEVVTELKRIGKEYAGTRAALEANLTLGDLYFDHGEPGKAVPWYQEAVNTTKKDFDRALALYSLGYALENSGKPARAIENFEKAMNLGETVLKGDLLMAIARSYEAMRDIPKARATYDKILSQLPNTEYAKTAETLKAQLQ